jgi:hypothetical protein
MISCFVPQNQAEFGLLVAPQNRWRGDDTRHTSRSSGLPRVKASRARVFWSGLKTGGGVITGDARGIIADVTSKES